MERFEVISSERTDVILLTRVMPTSPTHVSLHIPSHFHFIFSKTITNSETVEKTSDWEYRDGLEPGIQLTT
jgi:hypothetical protein